MYVARLSFEEVLNIFYCQNRHDLMLLFVSSLDGNDKSIIKEVIDNAYRVDRITGERISFFVFAKEGDNIDYVLSEWIRDIPDYRSLYGKCATVTMETADDICNRFNILRTSLPAFILISKDKNQAPFVYSIHDYDDFESFLTPLNILHSYIEDKSKIISGYNNRKNAILSEYYAKRRRTLVTQLDVDKRNIDRDNWRKEITRLTNRKEIELRRGELERANKREIEISALKNKLEENLELKVCGEDVTVPYPQEELDNLRYPDEQLREIRNNAVERLNIALNAQDGLSLIGSLQDDNAYSDVVSRIMKEVATKDVRISNVIERIKYEIREFGFDVFISCKSQDYEYAHEIYSYLKHNGLRPFLADMSIKEVGIDQYTALIGEVINVCQNMVVFATNVDYLQTPYVVAEWHAFINDINTGHKPNAKIVTVLSPEVDIHSLPTWLRDKQYFTTEDYQDNLVHFLSCNNTIHQELREHIEETYRRCLTALRTIIRDYTDEIFEIRTRTLISEIEREHGNLNNRIEEYYTQFHSHEESLKRREVKSVLNKWEEKTDELVWCCKRDKRQEELLWEAITNSESSDLLTQFIEQYPRSIHIQEARTLLRRTKIANNSVGETKKTFELQQKNEKRIKSIWSRLFGNRNKPQSVYSSVFAPAEIAPKQHLLVQVYLHLPEETEKVKSLASEADKNAERRGYEPLEVPLKKGDNVEIELNVNGDSLLYNCRKSVVWQGSFVKRAFDFVVPSDISVSELSCSVNVFVNGAIAGELIFLTAIVDSPRQLNTNVYAKPTRKLFISYSHKDFQSAEKIAKIHEALGIDVFFDKHRLKAGYIYSEEISKFIQTADTFVLCWSDNAAKSDYVERERQEALSLAYPQYKPREQARLRIHPYNIKPRTVPPADMIEHYHFEEL